MHSLEPEYLELHAAGEIDAATASRAIAAQRGSIFSVFEELRFALYAAVAAITSGIGILVKQHLDRIGPMTLILVLALAAAGCYAAAIRTHLRGETRSLGGDYVLLLGALLLSADVGYAESQFHWLGSQWSWHLLILAAVHAGTAYALDSRLVLSASLASLAGWFGIEGQIFTLLRLGGSLHDPGLRALACACGIFAWREVHRRVSAKTAFLYVFDNFAANIGFCGALSLSFITATRLTGVATLMALAVVCIRKGLRDGQEIFVIYGVCYTSLGLCFLALQTLPAGLPAAVMGLATVVAGVALLWFFHQRLKAAAA
jgi:hypothetical protein